MISILMIVALLLVAFFAANAMLKRTNWYKNQYCLSQDVLSSKSMTQLDFVNVGSNPARFGFNYEGFKGVNLSTGTQGLDYDLKLLKEYGNCLKPDGVVFIPLVPFTSISAYLDDKMPVGYHAKFARLLSKETFNNDKKYFKAFLLYKFPLWFNKRALFRLLKDVRPDNRLNIDSPLLKTEEEWEKDSKRWMKCWTDEFYIKDIEAPLTSDMMICRAKSVEYLKELIHYVRSRGWKPVVVSPPISPALAKKYNSRVKDIYLDSFIKAIEDTNVLYLDFTYDMMFTESHFQNALFLNKKGAQLFTKELIDQRGGVIPSS